MSGRSSWCFTDDHPGCRYAACTCACHAVPADAPVAPVAPVVAPVVPVLAPVVVPVVVPVVAPVEARPVPVGAQAELGFPDSIDGSTDDVATVVLSFRGRAYEVDLSAAHRDELRAALAPFVAAARRSGGA